MQPTTLKKSNWYFIQPTLSSTAGIIIGVVIVWVSAVFLRLV